MAALAGQAHASPLSFVRHSAIRHRAVPGGPLALTVTSVGPDGYAQTGQTITISGMVRNLTGSAMDSLSVGILSAPAPLSSMTAVKEFAAGTYSPFMQPVAGVGPFMVTALAAHSAATWTVRVPAKALGLTCFGVYPLTAEASDGFGTQLASSDVPLPFWPQSSRGCPRTRPADISWIWPLIDSPHQGPCQGVLLDNTLAASIRPGGRLSDLLAAASHYGASAKLSYAIDPALLDSLAVMRQPYQVGHAASCGDARQYPASSAAAAWLRGLTRVTASQDVFVTPYADVDIGALVRYGLDTDLNQAVFDGEQIAGRLLGRDPAPVPLPATGRKLAAVAWPAGGIANEAVLEYLAAELKISTVILAQPAAAPPATAGTVTRVTTGAGQPVNVLLANDALSQLLRSRAIGSRRPAASFSVRQLFLAETAMNVAANPSAPRPIIVTPPRRWSPSESLASDLLAETTTAPWLSPANIGQLSGLAPQSAGGRVTQSRPGAELSRRLLDKVSALDGKIGPLESIFFPGHDPTLRHAVFGIESSWWRSRGGTRQALAALALTSRYVGNQYGQLSLGGNRYVTLGGRSGSVIISVRNGLDYPIKVYLRVKVNDLTGSVSVNVPKKPILVPPGKIAEQKLSVQATQTGSALLHFSLVSPAGAPLPHGRLTMHVQASDFGRIALIICGAALAVFVLASAARAIRQGRPAPPGAGQAAGPQGLPGSGGEPDSVISGQPGLTAASQVASDPRFGSPGHGSAEEGQ